jgi:nucleoside-diphosphate-sugar epimerase
MSQGSDYCQPSTRSSRTLRLEATKKRVLITGGTGYLGRAAVKSFVTNGWEVAILSRSTSSQSDLRLLPPDTIVFQNDGTTEFFNVIFEAFAPLIVIHTAASNYEDPTSEQTAEMIASNLGLGIHLLESMRKFNCRNFINTGTYWSYYQGNLSQAVNLYASMKTAFEEILDYYVDAHGFQVQTLVLPDIYGPQDSRRKLLNILKEAIETGSLVNLTPGEQIVNLLHVSDASSAYVHVAEQLSSKSDHGHQKHCLNSNDQVSIRDLVEIATEIVGRPVPVRFGAVPYRTRQMMIPHTENRLPGWMPKINLRDGLHEFFA